MSKILKYTGVFLAGMYTAYACTGQAHLWHILLFGIVFYSMGKVTESEDNEQLTLF